MKIVIVGAGFGGIKTALNLAKDPRFQVTLISERSTFEYHAALYRSATGRSPLEVQIPLFQIFNRVPRLEVVADRASLVDPAAKHVNCQSGRVFAYDRLILALGSVTAYYGIKGLPEYSYGIKSVQEALELKQHLHHQLVESGKTETHYVVVGGGPTGIELAGEMASYLKRLYRKHRLDHRYQIDIVEAAPRLLPMLPESVSRKVERRLLKQGVKIYTGVAVKGETADQLMLPDGEIATHTVVWTAGVTNNPFFEANKGVFKLAKGNKVEVDVQLKAAPDVYVLGDSAATEHAGWAQTALYDADFVSQNLERELSGKKPLQYLPPLPIGAIPVGPNWSAVSGHGFRLYGRLGWWIRRLLDLKLYLGLLPPGLAFRTWLSGTKVVETCPICAK